MRGLQTEQHCFHILHAHSYFWELLKKDVLHTDDNTETYDLVNGFFQEKSNSDSRPSKTSERQSLYASKE